MMKEKYDDLAFEDSLGDDWSRDLQTVEVSLNRHSTWYVAGIAVLAVLVVLGRLFYLSVIDGGYYTARAAANVNETDRISAPRGLIVDRFGQVLATNQPVFSAVLNLQQFSLHPEERDETLSAAQSILGLDPNTVQSQIDAAESDYSGNSLVLASNITQPQVVAITAANSPTLSVQNDFERVYPDAQDFSTVLGYVGLPTAANLSGNPNLAADDLVGKSGLEAFYDNELQGTPGTNLEVHNAQGNVLRQEQTAPPKIGPTLTLTIDAQFQKYFSQRMEQGLAGLGKTNGAAIAINPQNGQVLALMSFPTFDNEVMSNPGNNSEKQSFLTSSQQPLFDRAISGNYSPGSTIKPLDSVALLKEGIVNPNYTIFSPGYLDIPNPYDPSKPTRYLDWRYQGNVDMDSALAQSSDVYFYETVGGFGNLKGLGIDQLQQWWKTFHLGQKTGIDLPGEASGFLPSPQWKQQHDGTPWLLGDTYNVAIGQGDLQLTPIQLIDYVASIANGGTIYKPVLNLSNTATSTVLTDLTSLGSEISVVQAGMRMGVTSPLGTAYTLNDLPFPVDAKTGSAQIDNNAEENAFFVGYIPASSSGVDNGSQIAILILVENSKQGSLNAVPIAKDVLNWYWQNRLAPGAKVPAMATTAAVSSGAAGGDAGGD